MEASQSLRVTEQMRNHCASQMKFFATHSVLLLPTSFASVTQAASSSFLPNTNETIVFFSDSTAAAGLYVDYVAG